MSVWIVLGSSPLARQSLAAAREDWPSANVITTNRGIELVETPDVFALIDANACKLWGSAAKAAAQRGTLCVTLQRDGRAMLTRGIDWFPVRYRNGSPFELFAMSGPWCLEYALLIGKARLVIMCGMDGYDPASPSDYFAGATPSIDDPERAYRRNQTQTEQVIQPLTQRLVDKYPDADVRCYGHPRYVVRGKNWRVITPL
jgi:hypothetical protein